MQPKNYYYLLGIDSRATREEVRSAYYLRVRVIHPDRFDPHTQRLEWLKANEMLAELNEAYSVLRDDTKRANYDRENLSTKPHSSDTKRNNGSDDEAKPNTKRDAPADHGKTEPTSSPQRGPTRLNFDELSAETKRRLLERRKGRGRHLSWQTRKLWLEIGGLVGTIVWVICLFQFANDYLWSQERFLGYAVLTSVSGLSAVFGVLGLWRWIKFPMRGFVFVTPLYFVKCRFNQICYWKLWQIVGVERLHHYLNGSYTHTTVTFTFDEGKESLKFNTQRSVDEFFERLTVWNEQTKQALENGEWEYFVRHDDFVDSHDLGQSEQQHSTIGIRTWTVAVLIGLFVSGGLTIGAKALNSFFDDKKSWSDAVVANSVPGYRQYLKSHQFGRWAGEANQRIHEQYDLAFANYQRKRTIDFDENASAAISSILTYAKQTHNYRVKVFFDRQNEIPADIEQRLKNEFNVSKIMSMGESFSTANMQAREQKILSAVRYAVNTTIPNDVLELSDQRDEPGVSFLVKYRIRSGRSLYFRDTDSHLSENVRPFYPGIYILWNFQIQIPDGGRGYEFEFESKPAREFRYAHSYGSETISVYDRMAETAFDGFQHELTKRLGLSQSSERNLNPAQPLPSPTPDVKGTFQNEIGSLNIEPTKRGFDFELTVGTNRCSGEISGNASWRTFGQASSKNRPDKEAFEDPLSPYYQKLCQLTFRFSDDSVSISQTLACSYFHGAECNFNGIYSRR